MGLSVFWLVFLIAICGAAALPDCKTLLSEHSDFTWCQELNTGESAVLWAANGTDAISIKYFMTDTQDMGWMGLGLNVIGSMKGADMWIVHRQGSAWAVADALAVAFAKPRKDKSQDVVLRSMEYTNGVWSAVLSRKLKPCDLENDYEIVPGQQFVMLWAHGSVVTNDFAGVTYHGLNNRGSVDITLLAEEVSKAPADLQGAVAPGVAAAAAAVAVEQLPAATDAEVAAIVENAMKNREAGISSSAWHPCTSANCDKSTSAVQEQQQGVVGGGAQAAVEVQAPKYTPPPVIKNKDGTFTVDIKCPRSAIPTKETTYLVCYAQVPNDQKYHIIRYESIWRSSMVHHSSAYVCLPGGPGEVAARQLLASNGTGPYDLDSHIKKCAQIVMVAPHRKAPPYNLPPEAGLPMGKGSYQIFVVEMHYYNPTRASGTFDPGSGLRVTFQPASVRGVDAGILVVGQYDLHIPPGQADYPSRTATCTPGCTKRFTHNLTVINHMFHGHYLSKTFNTSWVRNGVEQKPLAIMKRNDNNFQSWLPTDQTNNVIMPGDQLQLTCTYNSMGRKNTTLWGWSAREEMCFWFIMYYPAQPVVFCSQGFNDLLPLTVCSDNNEFIVAMYEPYYVTNNLTQVIGIVQGAIKSGRGIMPDPIMKKDKAYDLSQGCSASKPL